LRPGTPASASITRLALPVARVKVWDEAGDLFIDEPCYRIPGKRGWFFTVPIQIGDGEVIQFEVQDD